MPSVRHLNVNEIISEFVEFNGKTFMVNGERGVINIKQIYNRTPVIYLIHRCSLDFAFEGLRVQETDPHKFNLIVKK